MRLKRKGRPELRLTALPAQQGQVLRTGPAPGLLLARPNARLKKWMLKSPSCFTPSREHLESR